MINVLDRARRFHTPAGAAVCLVRAVILFSISSVPLSAHKKPVMDYLPRVGPMPLRFEAARPASNSFTMPPLDMGKSTKNVSTNTSTSFGTNQVLPRFVQLPVTNRIAKIAVPMDEPITIAPPATPRETDRPLQPPEPPSSTNENVFTPQMLVHFFQKNGTNRASSISVPIEATRPEPGGKASSATYVSP
jgi:hypothetical protein